MTQETAIIIGSAIGAIISAIIAISVVFINRNYETKKDTEEKKIERDNALKLYSHPIIRATEQLAWRLKEILDYKASFLLPEAPKNDYYYYKTNSTIYRLCSLLGWLQASKRESSYFNTETTDQHNKIQDSIGRFRNILADGDQTEVSILNYLAKLFSINISELNQDKKTRLGVKLESVIFKYISTNVKADVKKLTSPEKHEMLKEILNKTTSEVNKTPISELTINENIETAIIEISRKFWWIYRDWQYAVGDLMLTNIEGGERKFDIIGYGVFINKIENGEKAEKDWIEKISKLFKDLDVSISDRFDLRVDQLKLLFKQLIIVIEAFRQLDTNQNTITNKSFDELKNFATSLEIHEN